MATVSVVTANFNHGHLVRNAIRSIEAQTYPVLEHVIVDDASTDDSCRTLHTLVRDYPFVRVVENLKNLGPARTFGRGVEVARGDYVQLLSADDTLPVHSIARRMKVVQGVEDAAIICGDVEFIDERSGRVDRRRYVTLDKTTFFTPDNLVEQQKNSLYVVNGGSALIRRNDLLDAKMDDPGLRWHSDWFACNAIAYRKGVWYVPEVLHRFARSSGSYSRRSFDWRQQEPVLRRIFELLRSSDFDDVREHFRDSAILAAAPHVLRYMVQHREAWDFLTPSVVANAVAISAYRALRSYIPQRVLDRYVRWRTC